MKLRIRHRMQPTLSFEPKESNNGYNDAYPAETEELQQLAGFAAEDTTLKVFNTSLRTNNLSKPSANGNSKYLI